MRSSTHRLVRGVGCAHMWINARFLKHFQGHSPVNTKNHYTVEKPKKIIPYMNHLGLSYRRHIFIFDISSRNEVHVEEFVRDLLEIPSHHIQSKAHWSGMNHDALALPKESNRHIPFTRLVNVSGHVQNNFTYIWWRLNLAHLHCKLNIFEACNFFEFRS